MKRQINFSLSALIITVLGAAATFAIVQTATGVETFGATGERQAGEVPSLNTELGR